MTIRIDQLNPTINPERDHEFPAMRDGQTVKLRTEQVLALGQASDPQALKNFSNVDPATGRAAIGVSAANTPIDDIPALGLDPDDLNVQKALEALDDKVENFDQIEIASKAEAQAGTNNDKAITPLRMREGLNASGDAPVFACRAWVNFSDSDGTIRESGNISSVTRNAEGAYTLNFETALPDTNYAVAGVASQLPSDNRALTVNISTRRSSTPLGVTQCLIDVQRASSASFSSGDGAFISVCVFR